MSQENVEAVRRWLEALSGEEFDAAVGLVHPDVELVPPGGHRPYRGAESLRRWMEPDAFRDQVVTPVEIVVAADRKILARQHLHARGAGSGIELEGHSWSVWTFDEEGLITRIEIYLDHEEDRALEAPGCRSRRVRTGSRPWLSRLPKLTANVKERCGALRI